MRLGGFSPNCKPLCFYRVRHSNYWAPTPAYASLKSRRFFTASVLARPRWLLGYLHTAVGCRTARGGKNGAGYFDKNGALFVAARRVAARRDVMRGAARGVSRGRTVRAVLPENATRHRSAALALPCGSRLTVWACCAAWQEIRARGKNVTPTRRERTRRTAAAAWLGRGAKAQTGAARRGAEACAEVRERHGPVRA